MQATVASFDQAKAFDRVCHGYLFTALRLAGLPEWLVSSVETLYHGAQSRVLVNRSLTDKFPIHRGVRQGCPLSSALYARPVSPLIVRLATDPSIRAFPLPGSALTLVLAYADDATIIVRDEVGLQNALQVFDEYWDASGASVNREKSAALFINLLPSSGFPCRVLVRPEVKIPRVWFYAGAVAAASCP